MKIETFDGMFTVRIHVMHPQRRLTAAANELYTPVLFLIDRDLQMYTVRIVHVLRNWVS